MSQTVTADAVAPLSDPAAPAVVARRLNDYAEITDVVNSVYYANSAITSARNGKRREHVRRVDVHMTDEATAADVQEARSRLFRAGADAVKIKLGDHTGRWLLRGYVKSDMGR
jgi:hypothetical protein